MKIAAALAALLLLPACPSDGDDDDDDDLVLTWENTVDLTDGAILSFWGDTEADVFAVGGSMLEGGGDGIILRHQGDAWTRMTVDSPTLWWVHRFASNDVFAVGELGTVLHWDGNDWTTMQTGMDYTLWGVWGASPSELWAVGGNITGARPSVMLHYDGDTWSEVAGIGMDGELLFKVWGTAANNAYAIGDGGAIIHYDGSEWTRIDSGTTERLLTVRGRSADDIYAVGGITRAVMLHFDGTEWTEVETGMDAGLMGVWTAPGRPVVISGFRGLVAAGDYDIGFTLQTTPTGDDLHAVWGDSAGSYLAGGGNLLTIGARKGAIIGVGDIATDPMQ